MSVSQPGLLRVLRAIWVAKSKVDRAEVERLADQLERQGEFDEDKRHTPPSEKSTQ